MSVLHFDPFELDTDRRLLLRDGEEVHISKKAFELLRVLIERAPKAISKTELLELVWPGTFISETTMPGVISELRDALGEDPHDPKFIRTVHAFGYAFIVKPKFTSVVPHTGGTRAARLIVRGREMFLNTGDNIIGRDPDVTIYVDDLSVSRKHARIVVTEENAVLEDLGSKNGTLHNGKPVVGLTPLRDRDVITTGNVTHVFRESVDAGTTMTNPKH